MLVGPETLGSAPNIILASGGGLPRRLGQRVIGMEIILSVDIRGGQTARNWPNKVPAEGSQVICCLQGCQGNEEFGQISREGAPPPI